MPGETEEFGGEEEFNPFFAGPGPIWTPPAPQLYAGEIIELFRISLISSGEARELLERTYGIELD